MTRQLPVLADRRVRQRLAPLYAEHPEIAAADALPFVGITRRGTWDGPGRRCHWLVRPSGDYAADCQTGAGHAGLLFRHMRDFPDSYVVMRALVDMIRVAGGEVSGVEVGFLDWIAATVNAERGAFLFSRERDRQRLAEAVA